MAGLLDTAAQPATGAPAGSPPSPPAPPAADPSRVDDSDEDGEQPNVTPEEQAQYESFVNNGLKVIYGKDANAEGEDEPGARPDILNRLKESSDPLENLANTAVWLVTMLETSAEKGGTQLDDGVVMHGGKAILEELAEVAEAAAIHDYSDKEMEGAWYKALDLYRETATQDGRVDPDQLKQQFGEIEEADKQGRMGDLLPQLGSQSDGQVPPKPVPGQTEEM